MAKCELFICDICDMHIHPEKNTRFTVRSSRFVDNWETWFPTKKKWDICLNCLEEIKRNVRKEGGDGGDS